MTQRFFPSPGGADHLPLLDLCSTMVSARLEDLPIQTRGCIDTAHDLRIKGESVRGDQRDAFEFRSAGVIPEEGECVSIASPSHDCRRPKLRPDLDRGEDPNGLFLVVDDWRTSFFMRLSGLSVSCDGSGV